MILRGLFQTRLARIQARRSLAGFLALLCAFAVVTACSTNNNRGSKKTKKSSLNGSLDGSSLDGNQNSTSLNVTKILRANATGASELDLIGDGTGTIGRYCGATDDPSGCSCQFTFKRFVGQPNEATETRESPVGYHEENLVRCNFKDYLPEDLAEVVVKLHHQASDTFSNPKTFFFNAPGTQTDYLNENNYQAVKRHQCHDTVNIPSSLAPGTMLDPFQTDAPELAYPLNYYYSNPGNSLAAFTKTSVPENGQGFVCPEIGKEPARDLVNVGRLVDYRIYSDLPDTSSLGKNYLIYPPQPGFFDRANFLLARKKMGKFNIPVNNYVFPATRSVEGGSDDSVPSIGYGVQPLPNGDSEECPRPADLPIPADMQWVKVWFFRAPLQARTYRISNKFATELGGNNENSGILCNPGQWNPPKPVPAGETGNKHRLMIFPDCRNSVGGSDARIALDSGTQNPTIDEILTGGTPTIGRFADRVIYYLPNASEEPYGMCVRMNGSRFPASFDPRMPNAACPADKDGPGCVFAPDPQPSPSYYPNPLDDPEKDTPIAPDVTPRPAFTQGQFAPGTDVWVPAFFDHEKKVGDACGGLSQFSLKYDPLNLCRSTDPMYIAPSPSPHPLPSAHPSYNPTGFVPYDNDPTSIQSVPFDLGSSRADYLYVVTPPSVMLKDMRNPDSAVAKRYTPYRYYKPGSCVQYPKYPGYVSPSFNPLEQTGRSDCIETPTNAIIIRYGLKKCDINTNCDESAKQGIYPVCALQKRN